MKRLLAVVLILVFALLLGQAVSVAKPDGPDIDSVNQGPGRAPAPTATPLAANIAGKWYGEAHNLRDSSLVFEITIIITSPCRIGAICGKFDIPAIPCAGSLKLIRFRDNLFQFQAGNFFGSCVHGARDTLRLLPDDTLEYVTSHPRYGTYTGILRRVG